MCYFYGNHRHNDKFVRKYLCIFDVKIDICKSF